MYSVTLPSRHSHLRAAFEDKYSHLIRLFLAGGGLMAVNQSFFCGLTMIPLDNKISILFIAGRQRLQPLTHICHKILLIFQFLWTGLSFPALTLDTVSSFSGTLGRTWHFYLRNHVCLSVEVCACSCHQPVNIACLHFPWLQSDQPHGIQRMSKDG